MSATSHFKRKMVKETLYRQYQGRLPQAGMPAGKVFYVDGTGGSDDSQGNSLDCPFKTITHALTKCTAYNHDYIYVKNDEENEDETWPVAINKNWVHVIGMGNPGISRAIVHPDSDTDVSCFQLRSNGQYCEIANFSFGGGDTHAGIELGTGGQVDGAWIHDCLFGHYWRDDPLNGIMQPTTASRGGLWPTRIERCTFLGDLEDVPGAITGNAIDLLPPGQIWRFLQIIDCSFLGCAVGINIEAQAYGCEFRNNRFVVDGAADGEAITLAAVADGNLIDGNSATEGNTAMSVNPYKDLGSNHWGLNYRQGVSILPATV